MTPTDHADHKSATSAAIEVKGLNLAYGSESVLHDIHLSIPKGSVVGLVGANGAGKTTLLRSLLGLSVPQSGSIALLDDDPADLSDLTRGKLGYVSQVPALIEWMKVGQYLDLVGSFYPTWNADFVDDTLRAWDLNSTSLIGELSLGEKQRVALLQALGHSPELLVLDEPVASFDPLMRREFMRKLFADGVERTVVISSHLLTDLERIITRLVIMKDGRVLLNDEWDALVESLSLVTTDSALPDGPGIIRRQCTGGLFQAVIDARLFDVSLVPDARRRRMNLDEMFVQLLA